jgi:hypothetical protein
VSVGSATITATYYGQHVDIPVTVTNPSTAVHVYYAGAGGGDRSQCTGLVDANYPGSGTGQACRFSNFMYCATDESSSSVYTGAVQGGDICQIKKDAAPQRGGTKADGTAWITNDGNFISPPSGTTAHHTIYRGENWASCSPSNRSPIWAYHVGWLFDLRGVQNFELQCIDDGTYQDCNPGLNADVSFDCPAGGGTEYGMMVNNFTASVRINDDCFHGFQTALVGTIGPDFIINRTCSQMSYLAGWNYDNPFGYTGNRSIDLVQNYVETYLAGFTEDQPHSITAVSRDGAGNLSVTFSSVLNYIVGTNLVLTGMTPSDLNGTFPVTAVTFNQQTASITGGICNPIASTNTITACVFNTAAAPAFGIGAFVEIAGAIPTWLNGHYEVHAVSGTGFTIIASPLTRQGWTISSTEISSGGTAATANVLTAAASGAAESASVLGFASHVYNAHRGMDQNDGGVSNGDCDGSGPETIGDSLFDHITNFSCTQDGLDQLHATMRRSYVTNSVAINTSGAGFKFGNADDIKFQNNIAITPCMWFLANNANLPPEYNQYLALGCRAGAMIGMNIRAWSKAVISNFTGMTNFGAAFNVVCSDQIGCGGLSDVRLSVWQNTLINGFLDTNDPAYNGNLPSPFFNGGSYAGAPWTFSHNQGYNVRTGPTGPGNNWSATNSLVATIPNISSFAGEVNSQTYNYHLAAASAAIAAGVTNSYTPATDQAGVMRTIPSDEGALTYAALFPNANRAFPMGIMR